MYSQKIRKKNGFPACLVDFFLVTRIFANKHFLLVGLGMDGVPKHEERCHHRVNDLVPDKWNKLSWTVLGLVAWITCKVLNLELKPLNIVSLKTLFKNWPATKTWIQIWLALRENNFARRVPMQISITPNVFSCC